MNNNLKKKKLCQLEGLLIEFKKLNKGLKMQILT